MALVVAVAHAPGDHIGHRLEAAMGMVGKSRDVVRRIVRAELVQHQEGIDRVELGRADDAVEFHASAVARGRAAGYACDRPWPGDRAIHALLLLVAADMGTGA